MLKKLFAVFLFVVFASAFLIVAIQSNTAKAMSDLGSSDTTVAGIVWENTTWTQENSPYLITDTVQIPSNVTLMIEPGVTVTKPSSGDMFLVHGTVYAHGSMENKAVFDGGGNSNFFSAKGSKEDAFLDLDYCIIKDGNSFWPPTGYSQYGHFILRHSELINLATYSHVWYPPKDVCIEYNKFVNTAGFSIGHSDANVYIRYNLFTRSRAFVVKNWASYGASKTIVKYNSFIDMSGIVLELPSGYDSTAMTATENYWETNDTDVIDSMIYDKNDDITCADFIEYLPVLNRPHPDTPILLEDVRVDVDGFFRKDVDDKWRCHANITIENNCLTNITISWVYLNAIKITYTDDTFEELDIEGNETLDLLIQPQMKLSINWTITTFGFTKEPKNIWVLVKTPISEAYGTITLTKVIPEFPSLIILTLFMTATLLTVIVYKRKHSMQLHIFWQHASKHQTYNIEPSIPSHANGCKRK